MTKSLGCVVSWSDYGRRTIGCRVCWICGARTPLHDFDEIGVPAGTDTAWHQCSTEEWIQRVLRCQADGSDVLLTG